MRWFLCALLLAAAAGVPMAAAQTPIAKEQAKIIFQNATAKKAGPHYRARL